MILKKINPQKLLFLFGIVALVQSFGVEPALENKIYGRWEVENIVFVSPPDAVELGGIFNNCNDKEVVITKSKFI